MAVSLKDSLVTIWRVENENGVGPFQNENLYDMLRDRGLMPESLPDTPSPLCDMRLRPIFMKLYEDNNLKQWHFGFIKREHYDIWFNNSELHEIWQAHGYFLKKYIIDPQYVYEGTNQCLFWRPAAMQYEHP